MVRSLVQPVGKASCHRCYAAGWFAVVLVTAAAGNIGCRHASCSSDSAASPASKQGSSEQPAESPTAAPLSPSKPISAESADTSRSLAGSDTDEFARQIESIAAGESGILRLVEQPMTTDQLSQLASVPAMVDLLLDAGGPGDEQLAIIAQLSQLEHLRIRNEAISDLGIKRLCNGQLDRLEILNLPQSTITAEGIRHLKTLPKLSNLRLGGKQIDDIAVAEIAKLPNLKSLHLIGPSITGNGLRSLAGARKLASLYIDDCDIDDAAWSALFDAKPSLHVHVDQQHHDRDPGKHAH